MKTKNQYRKIKISEIAKIYQEYADLKLHERLYMVIHKLMKKAIQKSDHTEMGSINELAGIFERLFINPKTGMPNTDAINMIKKLLSRIRKDKGHPHIRPYAQPHVERTVNGFEVVRWYIGLLMGSEEVKRLNLTLEKQKTGLTEIQASNRDLVNVKRVMKEADEYAGYLEAKQEQADGKRRKRK